MYWVLSHKESLLSYKGLNLEELESAIFATSSARSDAPLPPFSQWEEILHSTPISLQ